MSFDINKHEWSDEYVAKVDTCTDAISGDLSIWLVTKSSNTHYTSIELNKQDATAIFKHIGDKAQAIAIAKHFGLTADWIAVNESLPDVDGSYLVYQSGGYRFSRDFIDGEWVNAKSEKYGDITHWMPLPQPPQSKE